MSGPTPREWQLAEQAGHRSPHRMQSLLAQAVWDEDGVRDDLRDFVVDTLGDPEGVLVADDPAEGPKRRPG